MGIAYTWNRNGIVMGRNWAEIGLGLEWDWDGISLELHRGGIWREIAKWNCGHHLELERRLEGIGMGMSRNMPSICSFRRRLALILSKLHSEFYSQS